MNECQIEWLRGSVSTVDVYDKHDTCVECTERAHMGTKECTERAHMGTKDCLESMESN